MPKEETFNKRAKLSSEKRQSGPENFPRSLPNTRNSAIWFSKLSALAKASQFMVHLHPEHCMNASWKSSWEGP
eukprot:15480050-Alexandrium_andersonii.AAC.1